MRRYLTMLVLIASFVLANGAAHAVAPWVWFMAAEVLNTNRAKPLKEETPGLNPWYAVYSGGAFRSDGIYDRGNFEGDCLDPRVEVDRIARGAVVVIQPGVVAEGAILGMDITSNSAFFPKRMGVYHEKLIKLMKDNGQTLKLDSKYDHLVSGDDPRLTKYEIAFCTDNLPYGTYEFTVWVYSKKYEKGGLGLWTKGKPKLTPSLCHFRVADQDEMRQSANSVQVQEDLAVSEGLKGGPPQVSVNQIVVNSDTIQRLANDGYVQLKQALPTEPFTPAGPVFPTGPVSSPPAFLLPGTAGLPLSIDGAASMGNGAPAAMPSTLSPSGSENVNGLTPEQIRALQVEAENARRSSATVLPQAAPPVQRIVTRVTVYVWAGNQCYRAEQNLCLADFQLDQVVEFRRGVQVDSGRIINPGVCVATACVQNITPRMSCIEFRLVSGNLPAAGDCITAPMAQGGLR